MIPSTACGCAWRVVVSMRSSKESSQFFIFSVDAVALHNLPQTFRFRGRERPRPERSKRGYSTLVASYRKVTYHEYQRVPVYSA